MKEQVKGLQFISKLSLYPDVKCLFPISFQMQNIFQVLQYNCEVSQIVQRIRQYTNIFNYFYKLYATDYK